MKGNGIIAGNDLVFNVEVLNVGENQIHLIKIEDVTDKLIKLIDKHIVSICENDDNFTIEYVKRDLNRFFKAKDQNTKMGSVAEFIAHLYLKSIGFKQECSFRNLEEGSIKKGFDGYYSISSEEWIMESKSGAVTTKGISHKKKLKEAYTGLSDMIAGKTNNDPWRNALNHAKKVGSSDDIIDNIRNLTIMFSEEKFSEMKELNVVTSSTIFHQNSIKTTIAKKSLMSELSNFEAKKIKAICIDKKSIENLINCLIK